MEWFFVDSRLFSVYTVTETGTIAFASRRNTNITWEVGRPSSHFYESLLAGMEQLLHCTLDGRIRVVLLTRLRFFCCSITMSYEVNGDMLRRECSRRMNDFVCNTQLVVDFLLQ